MAINDLGSKQNPYDSFVYGQLCVQSQWDGGWVSNNGTLFYSDEDENTYSGNGSKNHPYPNTIYNNMIRKGFWTGGWVISDQNKLIYSVGYNSNFAEEMGELGSMENPCPYNVFENMCSNDLWEGGWVGTLESCYFIACFDLNSGNGSSGCGGNTNSSGSALGSGCGNSGSDNFPGGTLGSKISAGSEVLGNVKGEVGLKVIISWTDGYTEGCNLLAQVSAHIRGEGYATNSNTVSGYWTSPYTVILTGSISFSKDNEMRTLILSGTYFLIPGNCRINEPT